MRFRGTLFLFLLALLGAECATPLVAEVDFVHAAPKPGEPTDLKARRAYASAMDWELHHHFEVAISDYRKADKIENGNCTACRVQAYRLAVQNGAWKEACEIAREGLFHAKTDEEKGEQHGRLGRALFRQALDEKKDKLFLESRDELTEALRLNPRLTDLHYILGQVLAHRMQDEAARNEFGAFLKTDRSLPVLHARAERFVERVELARARMAPAFSVTTLDGQKVALDGLAGKVVLIDFWATWCGPCREALPHVKEIAKRFSGQPFVVLSVSLDSDEPKWKEFVAKNNMTWMQYRDGSFDGTLSHLFAVTAIPATFTIDADGVLEDQHVGDANIEGKLKKLIAQAAAHNAAATRTAGETQINAH